MEAYQTLWSTDRLQFSAEIDTIYLLGKGSSPQIQKIRPHLSCLVKITFMSCLSFSITHQWSINFLAQAILELVFIVSRDYSDITVLLPSGTCFGWVWFHSFWRVCHGMLGEESTVFCLTRRPQHAAVFRYQEHWRELDNFCGMHSHQLVVKLMFRRSQLLSGVSRSTSDGDAVPLPLQMSDLGLLPLKDRYATCGCASMLIQTRYQLWFFMLRVRAASSC